MSDKLHGLIDEAIALKQGNKEFALFYAPRDDGFCWEATIGNRSEHVSLGEIDGEFTCDASQPEFAVRGIIARIKESANGRPDETH